MGKRERENPAAGEREGEREREKERGRKKERERARERARKRQRKGERESCARARDDAKKRSMHNLHTQVFV